VDKQPVQLPYVYFQAERTVLGNPSVAAKKIEQWVWERPAFWRPNADLRVMSGLIRRETHEPEEELSYWDTPDFSDLKLSMELLDVYFFLASFTSLNDFWKDFDVVSIHSRLNGRGSRSAAFEELRDVSGNIPDSLNPKKDVEYFLALLFSIMRHAPVTISFSMIDKILEKNGRNYPAAYFNGRHPVTGELLDEEGQFQQYKNGKDGLRIIRDQTGNKLGGLDWKDHESFYRDWMTVGPERASELLRLKKTPV